jgi:hypothetical protein
VQQSFSMAMGAVIKTAAIDFSDFPLEVGAAFDLWLTYLAARTGLGAYYVPERLARYRSHSASQTAAISPANLRAAQYVYSRLLQNPGLTEYADFFRKRRAEMQIAEGIAMLRRGSAREARAHLCTTIRSRKNFKVVAALLLALAGDSAALTALSGYDYVKRTFHIPQKYQSAR